MSERTFHILGVPLRSGSFMPGTESDAPAYREAGLLESLLDAGIQAVDDGDLAIPSYLPHHTIPPVRNWPGPRIVWDLLSDRLQPVLGENGHVPLVIGCDCSVIVGTAQALAGFSGNLHVLYIDGDFDDARPDPEHCQSAAAIAIWLLTKSSPFWSGPLLHPSQVTVVGWSKPPRSLGSDINSISLRDIRARGATQIARDVLAAIPASADIVVHFDVDVLADIEFPAAYFPHDDGLTMEQVAVLLGAVLSDERVRAIEISEYSALRDLNRVSVRKLIEMLTKSLGGKEKMRHGLPPKFASQK